MTHCAAEVIRRYFADGIIPEEPETFCPREVENFFVDQTKSAVHAKLLEQVMGH